MARIKAFAVEVEVAPRAGRKKSGTALVGRRDDGAERWGAEKLAEQPGHQLEFGIKGVIQE